MKSAIITGASAGLGLEFVKQIRDEFPEIARYYLISRRGTVEVEVPGVELCPMALDLTKESDIEKFRGRLKEDKPEVTLLIGNAGCGYLGNFDESNRNEQLRTVELNIWALTAVTHAVLPYMPQGSHIINISSIASFVPNTRMTVYSATKSYVTAFSRGLHEELKTRGISVTAVCSGPMDTEFIRLGGIKGNSKTFDVLPYCNPVKVARGALVSAKKGRAVYTPRVLYKIYRVLASLVPHAIMVHTAKT